MTPTQRIWALADANWRLFRSLKLTLVLLSILAVGGAVGSFFPQLPQNPALSLEALRAHYPAWAWGILSFFQVFDLFHSWWFSAALVSLTLNLLACSAPRIPALWADLRRPMNQAPPGARSLALPAGAPEDTPALRAWLAERLGISARRLRTDAQDLRFESGRVGRPGFLMVHLGLGLLLVAGAWSQVAGRDGSLVLEPGQRSDALLVSSSDGRVETLHLPFEVACKDFFIERYGAQRASVRDYVSELQIYAGGRLQLERRVEVNQPLAYGGFHFYQTAFQRVPRLDRASLFIADAHSARHIEAKQGDELGADERGVRYRLLAFHEDFKNLGPAIQVAEAFPDGRERSFWVLQRRPGLVKRHRAGGLELDLKELRLGYATVLSAARDPATVGIWLGSLIMLLGLLLVFSLRHRALWLRRAPQGVELLVWAHRGQDAWVGRIERGLRKPAGGEETP